MKSESTLSVGGFLFHNEADASLARIEEQKIEYIEARMDYSSPESIRYVYEKSIQENLFKTPVGLRYMKQLQEFLLSQPQVAPDTVSAIPLQVTFGEDLKARKSKRAEKTPAEKRKEEKQKSRFTISVVINVLLGIAVVAMFYISLKSDQPNVFNYERTLLNKYASWEQELTEREQVIREKELELKNNQ